MVGTAQGWTAGDAAALGEVIVAAAHRGQGIGAHLVAAVVSEAAKRGCAQVRSRIASDHPARGFLARLGWVETVVVPGQGSVELYRDT